ncbi:hypothetical protein EDB83DRAFT_2435038 [Lactarius deliciosus]|nr:hypothetical protein EDB83DRAFT_2435038 [Lactarius deliciosus]
MHEPAKDAVFCSHCSLIAHSKCAGRAALTYNLRSKLPKHAHFAAAAPPSSSHTCRTLILRARARLEATSTVIVTSESGSARIHLSYLRRRPHIRP